MKEEVIVYECKVCGEPFGDKLTLYYHYDEEHNHNNEDDEQLEDS